ncbi:MAG: serine/threonine-protein kinase [Vicinamibacterales bacterium]
MTSSSSAGTSAPAATAIGRYALRACLASGATGHVYLADDPATDTQVAVKVLAADLQDEPETRERFYREARILAELAHPNIVRVLDIGEEQGRPFIAMELLEGLGLADHLRANPGLPLAGRIDLIIQLYAGLEAAHAQGTVHRDVKPANIIVRADGLLKIFDFGLARLHESTLTANGAVVGSPGYMSPEQVEGRRVDQRSDIFSAAAVGYLILSGRAPFESRNLPLVLDAVLNEAPAALSDSEAPEPLAHVLLKALEKSPDARYQSCAELLADLRGVYNTVVHS